MRVYRPWILFRCFYHGALFRIRTSEKVLYLTFDDGPDPETTPELLDILNNNNIKALFFCNGKAAEKYPELIKKTIDSGHLIGNHGYSHFNGWRISADDYCDDVKCASRFTSDYLFRPPYGRLTIRQFRRLGKSFRIIFWDIMAYDFDKNFGAERSLKMLNKKIRPGSIIVLHDAYNSTSRHFLERFIKLSLSKNYKFQLLS